MSMENSDSFQGTVAILADSFYKGHNNTLPGDPITNMEVEELVSNETLHATNFQRGLVNNVFQTVDGLKHISLKHIPPGSG